ncbi:MAG: hypothetical protein K2Y21_09460 [Phycisphaerales bacterium]|nr:hypothetical protein [Phycisphaerales bacterium]
MTPTVIPVIVRHDGQYSAAIPPGAQPPFDVVLVSQNAYLRYLLDGTVPTPFDTHLAKSNQQSRQTASDLAVRIASMPSVPATVQQERQLRSEGAKSLKLAQSVIDFQQTAKILENMGKSPEQLIVGIVMDLLA